MNSVFRGTIRANFQNTITLYSRHVSKANFRDTSYQQTHTDSSHSQDGVITLVNLPNGIPIAEKVQQLRIQYEKKMKKKKFNNLKKFLKKIQIK